MNITKDINSFIQLSQDFNITEKELTSKATSIKKQYTILIKNLRMNGKLSPKILNQLRDSILKNYKDLKIYPQFNEILEDIANQYLVLADNSISISKDEISKLRKIALDTHVVVLGTPGSKSQNYSYDYLVTVIRGKLDKKGINNTEILEILKQKSKDSSNLDDFPRLANNTLIVAVDNYLTTGKPELTNPLILTVLSDLANYYKATGNIQKYQEIYEKALSLRVFEKTQEYQNILNDRNNVKLSQTGFIKINLSAGKNATENERFEEFFKQLCLIPAFEHIFTPVTGEIRSIINPGESREHNIMSKEEKIRNIFRMLETLRKKYPNIDITSCFIGKDSFLPPEKTDTTETKLKSFDDYVVFPLDNSPVCILESFGPQEGAIYTAYTRDLPKIVSTTRTKARDIDGVSSFNHTQTYVFKTIENIIKKIENEKLRQQLIAQAKQKQETLEALETEIQNQQEIAQTTPTAPEHDTPDDD